MASLAMTSPTQGARIPALSRSQTLQATLTLAGGTLSGVVAFYDGKTGVKLADGSDQGAGVWRATGVLLAYGTTAIEARATVSGSPVVSAQQIVSVADPKSGTQLAPNFTCLLQNGTWAEAEIGAPALAGGIPAEPNGASWNSAANLQNWPWGYVFDGYRVDTHPSDLPAISGGPRVSLVTAGSTPMGARLAGDPYVLRLELRQWDAVHYGQSQNRTADATWLVPGQNSPDSQWGDGIFRDDKAGVNGPNVSNFKPGQSRAAYLPNEWVPGTEVYWGFSQVFDAGSNWGGGYYAAGIDYHNNGQGGSNSDLALWTNENLVFFVRSNPSLSSPNISDQHSIYVNEDGTKYEDVFTVGGGDPASSSIPRSANYKPVSKGVWIDHVYRWCWSQDGTIGGFQWWIQVNKSGYYVEVFPWSHMATMYMYLQGGTPVSGRIIPYFGMYRGSSTPYPVVMWFSQIRRGSSFYDAMVPGSRLGSAGAPTTPTAAGKVTGLTDDFASRSVSDTKWGDSIDARFRIRHKRRTRTGQPERRLTPRERQRLLTKAR